jgi:3-deoxy-D-manno-octulosonic-acid transferase
MSRKERSIRLLYNIVFTIFFLLGAPYYFFKMWRRGQWREGFGQRFGRYSSKIKQAVTNRHVLWIHAVSVGEVNICTQLISVLEPRLPNLKIVVSTTTSTGRALIDKLPSHIQKVYYPIDRLYCVNRAMAALHPQAMVLVEAEIWPNFLWSYMDRRLPVFLVNARLSERSYRGYRLWGFIFRPIFASFKGVGCQNAADAERLKQLGCRPEAIQVVGNLKFDAAKLQERRLLDVPGLLRQIGVPPQALILVGGSTHAGEEAILAGVFARLRARFPELFLIIAPRHFERGKQAGNEIAAQGVKFVYRSEVLPTTKPLKDGEVQCLLVNTTGELNYFYEHAHVIFVGKSLKAEGGQNPIEPGALGKAMVFGPHMENFAAIASAFVQRNGAVQVEDAAALEQAIAELLADEAKRAELGRNALHVVSENLGAIERTVNMIVSHLPKADIYVAPSRHKA